MGKFCPMHFHVFIITSGRLSKFNRFLWMRETSKNMDLLMFVGFNEVEKSYNEKTRYTFLRTVTSEKVGPDKFWGWFRLLELSVSEWSCACIRLKWISKNVFDWIGKKTISLSWSLSIDWFSMKTPSLCCSVLHVFIDFHQLRFYCKICNNNEFVISLYQIQLSALMWRWN